MGGREIPVEACPKDCRICYPVIKVRLDERECGSSDVVRTFPSGATRDTEKGKLDFEAFLSPKVLTVYAEYMDKHRTRSDGSLRDGDDWQKGIPKDVYMKSLMRHVMDVWLLHRGCESHTGTETDVMDALCAVIFNAMGLLYNELEGLD